MERCIELWVQLFNPADGSLNEFERGCLAFLDQLSLSACIEINKGICHSSVSLPQAVNFCESGL